MVFCFEAVTPLDGCGNKTFIRIVCNLFMSIKFKQTCDLWYEESCLWLVCRLCLQLLLFCEGTRFTETKRQASMAVARQKGLPELKHHLLPRTRGFVLTMNGVKGKCK